MARENAKQRIGILGGTFDPVHKGHLAVARAVLDHYRLDHILFIPAYAPPHKERRLTSFAHRVAMLEAAVKGDDRMSVSLVEAEREAPSYTVETLQELHRRMEPSIFFLIMGADMFAEIRLWYRYREIFRMAHLIVAARPGIGPERIAEQVAGLPGSFRYDPEQKIWSREDGFTIFYYGDIALPVSSSEIRTLLGRGDSAEEFLPGPVREYIRRHRLYPAASGSGQ